jgi:hypothetical protein
MNLCNESAYSVSVERKSFNCYLCNTVLYLMQLILPTMDIVLWIFQLDIPTHVCLEDILIWHKCNMLLGARRKALDACLFCKLAVGLPSVDKFQLVFIAL